MTRWVAWLGALAALTVGAALFAGVEAATSSARTTVGFDAAHDDGPVAVLPPPIRHAAQADAALGSSRAEPVPLAAPVPLADVDAPPAHAAPLGKPADSVLRGRVVDADGRPVAGAELHATPLRWGYYRTFGCSSRSYSPGDDVLPDEWERFTPSRYEPAFSDADGRFELPAPAAHNLTLYARADGHALMRRRGIAPGADGLEVVLAPAARLSLEVRDAATGATPRDVEVRAFRQLWDGSRTREHELTVVASDAARDERCFTVFDLGTLATELELRAPGYAPTFVRVAGQAPGSSRRQVVELQPGASLAGRALLPDGSPAADEVVRVEHPDIRGWRVNARTDASGAFQFEELPAGVLTLGRVEGWGVPAPAQRVELVAGERRTDFVVQRVESAALSGVLRAGDGVPIAGHLVHLERTGDASHSDWSEFEETDEQGAFWFGDVPPGELELSVHGSDLRVALTLDPDTQRHATLTLAGTARVTGTVRDHGAPLPHAFVQLVAADPSDPLAYLGLEAVTDERGRYAFVVPLPGEYHVSASRDEDSTDRSAVRALTLGADARVTHDIEFGAHTLTGRVREHHDGELLADVQLALTSPDLAEAFETASADDGSFRFHGLPPGEYTLGLRFNRRFVGLIEPRVVTLHDGAPQTLSVELEMCRGARIEGSAFTADGLPVQDGVPVAALLLDAEPPAPAHPRTLAIRDASFYRAASVGIWAGTSTKGGRYELYGLPEGHYALLAGSAAASAAEVRARGTRVWLAEHGTHAAMLEAVGDD